MKRKILTLCGVTIIGVTAITFVTRETGGVAAAEDEKFRINGTTLTAYLGTDTFVSIPDVVTNIGEEAFAGNETLTGIEIPDSVSTISYNAFKDCTALTDIIIPDSVEKIGPGAFEGCKALKMAEIGESVKSWGTGVFTNCDSLATLIVDKDNAYITAYNGAIYNGDMTMLYQVLPAREGENYVLPDTVEEIDTYSFWNLQNTKNVLISDEVEEIPAYAMCNMNSVENVVLSESVKSIGKGAFANNEQLKQIKIPASVKEIDKTAFSKCKQLKVYTAKDTYAETYCNEKNIEVIYKAEYPEDFIDSNPTLDELPGAEKQSEDSTGKDKAKESEISEEVKGNTNSNTSTKEDEEETEIESESVVDSEFEDARKYVHPLDAPEKDDVIGKTVIVAGQAVVLMDNKAGEVYEGSKDAEIVTQESVKEEVSAKEEQSKEEQQQVQTSVESAADDKTKENADKKEDTTTNNSSNLIKKEKNIPQREYYKQKSLTNYEISEKINVIGRLAFAESGLKEITIPDNVSTIEYGAFMSCTDLSDITISDKVTSIGTKAFEGTAWLNNWLNGKSDNGSGDFLVVGDGILIAYRGNASEVVIPDNVKQIGSEVFKGNDGITKVEVPDSVTKICAEAFRNCSKLTKITGGNNIKTVVRGAFYGTQIDESSLTK